MAFNNPRKATKTVAETFVDKSKPQKEKKVMFNTTLPEHVHRKLKTESFLTGQSMAQIVTKLVDENIEDRGNVLGGSGKE